MSWSSSSPSVLPPVLTLTRTHITFITPDRGRNIQPNIIWQDLWQRHLNGSDSSFCGIFQELFCVKTTKLSFSFILFFTYECVHANFLVLILNLIEVNIKLLRDPDNTGYEPSGGLVTWLWRPTKVKLWNVLFVLKKWNKCATKKLINVVVHSSKRTFTSPYKHHKWKWIGKFVNCEWRSDEKGTCDFTHYD